MRLTADKLELYNLPGRGKAASEISAALTVAFKDAVKHIGRMFITDDQDDIRAIILAVSAHVRPVMEKYSYLGAMDTEPRCEVLNEMARRIAKRYGLGEWERRELRYKL